MSKYIDADKMIKDTKAMKRIAEGITKFFPESPLRKGWDEWDFFCLFFKFKKLDTFLNKNIIDIWINTEELKQPYR